MQSVNLRRPSKNFDEFLRWVEKAAAILVSDEAMIGYTVHCSLVPEALQHGQRR